jgi:1-phosphofructokinase family hexose kinase
MLQHCPQIGIMVRMSKAELFLIITPNPALDRTIVVPGVRLGHRYRAEHVLVTAGGKGLNVARAAHTLGQPCTVCAPLGGVTGQYVAHLASEEGLTARWYWHSAGETRTCILLVDPHAHDATPLDEHGPTLHMDDWLAFQDTVLAVAPHASLAAICGSLPPGVPATALADMIASLNKHGCRVLVDTSREPLTVALDAAPYAIKVNRDELGAALNTSIDEVPQAAAALADVRRRGVPLAIVSLGGEGALVASDEGTCLVHPPHINSVSTVGSGDSLTAGVATGLLRGYPLERAMCLGVACGAADALTVGGGLIDHEDVNRLFEDTTVEWL